jgi:hypothetical protein
MLRRISLTIVAAAALAGSATTASAQGGPMRMRSAVGIILDAKDSLQLSTDQVAKLDSLAKALDAKNAPLREKARAARESGGGMEASREFFTAMRQNDEEAYTAAVAVLTDAQKPKAQELVTKARESMRRPPSQQ